jgi:hypothetical protein
MIDNRPFETLRPHTNGTAILRWHARLALWSDRLSSIPERNASETMSANFICKADLVTDLFRSKYSVEQYVTETEKLDVIGFSDNIYAIYDSAFSLSVCINVHKVSR